MRAQTGIVTSSRAGTCRVLAELANGAMYAIDVEFESVDFGCCGSGIRVTNFPSPMPTDAGIGGRG